VCPICNNEYSASVFKRHVFEYAKHQELIDKVYALKEEFFSTLIEGCLVCKKPIKRDIKKWENVLLFRILEKNIEDREFDRKYCSQKCAKQGNIPWNKGLTKENNEILKYISETRMGKNNPIFKVLNDPNRKEKWLKNVKESGAWEKAGSIKRGKTLEEIMGKEKATELKNKNSLWCKTGKPHLGHNHTQETKDLLRKITAEKCSLNKNKVSKPEMELFELLKQKYINEEVINQFLMGFYTIDIAFPKWKFAIEVDGDFYHSNKDEGFEMKFAIQKRNFMNDERKNTFLLNKNWSCLRIWVSQIEKDLDSVLDLIERRLCEKKILLK